MRRLISLILVCSCFVYGCATRSYVYAPTPSRVERDLRVINDEEIRRAFERQPQWRPHPKIAWYSVGESELMEELMAADTFASADYEIDRKLAAGYFSTYERWYGGYYYTRPDRIDFKALRLLAAREKCDMLVLVVSVFNKHYSGNGYAYLSALLLPILFVPLLDITYDHRSEVIILDVRDGHLYRHLKYEPESITLKRSNIYHLDEKAQKAKRELVHEAQRFYAKEIESLFRSKSRG